MKAKQKAEIVKLIPKKKCRYCLSTENLTYDHKIPLVIGGSSEPKNIQVLCKRCNGIKSRLSHRQVMALFQWVHNVDKSRADKGKKVYGFKNKDLLNHA